jgi:hypothetical protein
MWYLSERGGHHPTLQHQLKKWYYYLADYAQNLG